MTLLRKKRAAADSFPYTYHTVAYLNTARLTHKNINNITTETFRKDHRNLCLCEGSLAQPTSHPIFYDLQVCSDRNASYLEKGAMLTIKASI